MKLQLKKGVTSKLIDVFVQDTTKTDGSGLTGLVFNSASLSAYYYREGANAAVQIVLQTMTLGTWATGGFIVVDGTNMPGCYQLGLPDAALATGANSVIVILRGATNMVPVLLEIQLTDTDVNDAVRFGLTALPNVASGSAGAIPTTGTGANQLSVAAGLVTVGTNNDKTGYTASTVSDKTGYALTAGERTSIGTAVQGTTLAELAQAQPPTTPTLAQAVMLLYHALRNGRTVTATTDSLTNDAGTVIAKATVSDDGTTFTRAKLASGP